MFQFGAPMPVMEGEIAWPLLLKKSTVDGGLVVVGDGGWFYKMQWPVHTYVCQIIHRRLSKSYLCNLYVA